MSGSLPHQTTIQVLGVEILVRCRHRDCLLGIERYFQPHVCPGKRSPDIIVDCELAQADRYLFRARPSEQQGEALAGVHVHLVGSPTDVPWSRLSPPLPPFEEVPLAGRFVGLHAAAVQSCTGYGVLVAGERGAGKTTISRALSQHTGWAFLTDEVACLHRRSILVEPFAIAMGIRDPSQDSSKVPTPASQVVPTIGSMPVPVRHLVLLSRESDLREEGAPRLHPISPEDAFRELLTHHLDLGTSMSECMVTLLTLCEQVKAYRLTTSTYDHLLAAAETAWQLAAEGSQVVKHSSEV